MSNATTNDLTIENNEETLPEPSDDSILIDMSHVTSNAHTIEGEIAMIQEPNDAVIMDMSLATPNGLVVESKKDDAFNLKYELRFVLRTMALFGLCFTPKKWQKSGALGKLYYPAHRVYCLAIIVLYIFSAVKLVVGIVLYNNVMALQITFAAWFSLSAINASIWYFICSKDDLPKIVNLWQNSCQSSRQSKLLRTSVNVRFARRTIKLLFGGALAITVINTFLIAGCRFSPFETIRNDTIFMVAPTTEPIILWDVVMVISSLFGTAAYVFPPAFIMIICSLLSHQFKRFTSKYISDIRSNTDESRFQGCLISLRRQHQFLSKAVFAIDGTFSFYLAATFGTLIIMACFLMYQLVVARTLSNLFLTIMMIFWFIVIASKFALVGIATAQLHEKVTIFLVLLKL